MCAEIHLYLHLPAIHAHTDTYSYSDGNRNSDANPMRGQMFTDAKASAFASTAPLELNSEWPCCEVTSCACHDTLP